MPADYPVFIVSSGRSGTALIENIFREDPIVEAHHEYLCTHVQKTACLWTMGCIERQQAIDHLADIYCPAVKYSKKRIFLDSSNKASWIIDLLIEIFPKAKFAHLIRDGRKVVSSYFYKLFDECYDDDSVEILSRAVLGENIYPPPEKKYYWPLSSKKSSAKTEIARKTQFERICWHWGEINRVISDSLLEVPDNQKYTVRLEDLVSSEKIFGDFRSFVGATPRADIFEKLKKPHNVNKPFDILLSPEEENILNLFSADVMSLHGYGNSEQYGMQYENSVRK